MKLKKSSLCYAEFWGIGWNPALGYATHHGVMSYDKLKSDTCETECTHRDYAGGKSMDSPRRCQCYQYENSCKPESVRRHNNNEYFKGELKPFACYYDVCSIVGRFVYKLWNTIYFKWFRHFQYNSF